jgi:hypothetical protein
MSRDNKRITSAMLTGFSRDQEPLFKRFQGSCKSKLLRLSKSFSRESGEHFQENQEPNQEPRAKFDWFEVCPYIVERNFGIKMGRFCVLLRLDMRNMRTLHSMLLSPKFLRIGSFPRSCSVASCVINIA